MKLGTSKTRGVTGYALSCGASGAYAPGPDDEGEDNQSMELKCRTPKEIEQIKKKSLKTENSYGYDEIPT